MGTSLKGAKLTILPTNQVGRKARVGKVCFNGNKLAFFAGYNQCESCGIRGKILMNTDDIQEFQRMIGRKTYKEPFGSRFARRLVKHYNLQ